MSELSELFDRDPEQHTKESLDELIEKLRGMRGQFALNNDKKAGTVKPKKPTKPSVLAGAGISLKLNLLKSVQDGEKKE